MRIYIIDILKGLGFPDPSIEIVVAYYGTVDTVFPLTEVQEVKDYYASQREFYEIVD